MGNGVHAVNSMPIAKRFESNRGVLLLRMQASSSPDVRRRAGSSHERGARRQKRGHDRGALRKRQLAQHRKPAFFRGFLPLSGRILRADPTGRAGPTAESARSSPPGRRLAHDFVDPAVEFLDPAHVPRANATRRIEEVPGRPALAVPRRRDRPAGVAVHGVPPRDSRCLHFCRNATAPGPCSRCPRALHATALFSRCERIRQRASSGSTPVE